MSNSVQISGALVKAPELHFTERGSAVTNFTVRLVTGKKRDGEEYAPTAFIDCAIWNGDHNKQAENVAESFRDKDRVVVIGKLIQDEWIDKETGDKRTKLKVLAYEVAADTAYAVVEVQQDERQARPAQQKHDEPCW